MVALDPGTWFFLAKSRTLVTTGADGDGKCAMHSATNEVLARDGMLMGTHAGQLNEPHNG